MARWLKNVDVRKAYLTPSKAARLLAVGAPCRKGKGKEMARIRALAQIWGGSGIIDLTEMQTATDSFTAEVGKTYLLMSKRYNTDGSISSGATEVSRCNAFNVADQHIFAMVVKATATTVALTGTGNTIRYMALD